MIAHRVSLLTLTVLCLLAPGATLSTAQTLPTETPDTKVVRVAAIAMGSIYGVVLDEAGDPLDGVVVSALGSASAFAVTDREGQYRLIQLPPGPYVVRAHRDGFAAARSTLINVRSASKAPSSFTLRRSDADGSRTVLTAGAGTDTTAEVTPRDESEVAWRLRRLKRSVLKEEHDTPVDFTAVDDDWFFEDSLAFIGRAVGSSARYASSLFTEMPFYGQVNLLTATAYDDSGDLVALGRSSGVAFFSVGAPAGPNADWTARAMMNSGDISSWTMAGDYITRLPAQHRFALGMTYSLQRYEGGNFAALQAVPDGHRKVAALSASHEFDLNSRWTLGYGARYENYDYLDGYGLLSPTVKAVYSPVPSWRLHAKASMQHVAPGAEEFVPPADAQWVPPQRTFAPLGQNRFTTERVQTYEVGATRQFSRLSIGVRGFRQYVDDQLVTVFGAADPARLIAAGGHYSVASAGDAELRGWAVRVAHEIVPYVKGSVDYTLVSARWQQSVGADHSALTSLAPRALREPNERLHDLTTSIEAEVPQSATRFLVLYKLNSGFAGDPVALQTADGRFDMQLRQGLPFMGSVGGDWEMLLGVRSLFRPSLEDRSLYDELLVLRAPKRVIGGLQVRF